MFDEIKWMCAFAKYTTLKSITEPQSTYINKLILTPFRPFGIKCKKLIEKNLWKYILGHLGERVFHIFPLDHGWCPPYLIEFLWIMLQHSI